MKTPIRILSNLFVPAIAIALAGLCAPTAHAATDTWTGGGGNDIFWHTANNWGGITPTAGDNLIFTGTTGLTASNNFPVSTLFNSITFAAPAGAFVLEGRSVTIGTGVTNGQAFTPETINLTLIASNTVTIDVVNSGILNLGRELQGPSGFTIIGSGTVNLSYDATNQTTNVFAGTLEADGGTIVPASDLSLGTTNDLTSPKAGRLVLNSGILEASGGSMTNININRGIALGPTSGSGWGGIKVDTGDTLTYGGVMANNGAGVGGLYKAGYGTLDIFGANTYTGSTTNSIGTLLLDFTQPGAAVSGIINSSSALTLGGGNAGGGSENVAQLVMAGGSSADTQSFASTFATFGSSAIVATNDSGSSVALALGSLSHQPGGTLTFITPTAAGHGNITTTTANTYGILGGWALMSGDGNAGTAVTFNGHTILLSTNFAMADNSGNIINYNNYFVINTNTTIASQLTAAGNPETNLFFNGSAGGVASVDADNAGTTNDINTVLIAGGVGSGIFVGTNNVLRFGQYGAIVIDNTGGNNSYIGGTNSNNQNGSSGGKGFQNSENHGTLTAGGPTYNTPGEIVFDLNGGATSSETGGGAIVETKIADNGPSGVVTVIKTGPSPMKLDGINTYSGGLYLLQGRVQFASAEIAATAANDQTNAAGGGTGPIYILPGSYLFPSGIGTNYITSPLFVAGSGTAAEPLGAMRGGNYLGTITLVGDSTIGANANLEGQITGPFNLTFGSPATVNGGAILGNSADNWSGNTIFTARSNTGVNTITSSNNEVIPNGFGKGNLTLQGYSTGQVIWNMNGFNETVNGLLSAGTGGVKCLITNSVASTTSTLTVGDNDQSGTFSGLIASGAGAIAVSKIGAGVETLSGVQTYTGDTTISNGTLALTSGASINNSPIINVEGGTFDVSGVSYTIPATQSVNINGGGIKISSASSANGGSLNITNGTLEITTAQSVADYNGALSLGGTQNVIRVDNFPKEGGWPNTFPLVHYTSLNGDPNTIVGQFPSTQYQGFFSNDLASSTIYVVITNGPITVSVVWGGQVDGNWDATTLDWLAPSNYVVATNFADGDIVTFPDIASHYDIHVTDDWSPGGVTVSNNIGHTYVFDNTGSINGTNPVVKEGTGTWVIDNQAVNNNGVSDLSGGISIVAGTVQVGNGDTYGDLGYDSVHGPNPVGNNGTIVFDRTDAPTVANAISGTGNIVQEAGTVTLSGGNSFGGTLEVQTGATLVPGNNSALGSTNSGTTIDSGATLDLNGGGLGNNALNLGAEPVTVSGTGVGGNGAIVNSSATVSQQNALQQVTLTGDTTFGGASRWDIRGTGASLSTGGNAYNLTKIGAGQFSIVNATVDPMLNNIDIQGGILSVEQNTTGLGNPSGTLTVESTGGTLQVYNLTNQLNKQITLNGGGVTNTLNNAAGVDTIIGPMTLNGSVIVNGANNTTLILSNTIGGTGSLTKTGTNSTLSLAGTGSYTGATAVNDGTLLINGIYSGSTLTENDSQAQPGIFPVIVGGNGTNAAPVDIEETLWPGAGGQPATFGVGNGSSSYNGGDGALVFGDAGGTGAQIAEFSLGGSATAGSGVNDLITINGDFNGNFGHVKINPLATLTTNSPYTLITYTGVKQNNFNSIVGVVDALQPTRYTFSLDYSTAHEVLLDVTTGAGNLVWNNAAANGLWDINTSQNWTNAASAANDVFLQLDSVTFDDSVLAGPTNTVTIATNLIPGSIVVNTMNNYVFKGTGQITGSTGLEKDGSGTLIVGNTNSYTGVTLVNAGTLTVDATPNALGSLNSSLTIANGATLDVGGADLANNAGIVLSNKPIIVSGWGVNSNGAIINSSLNAQQVAVQNVTLVGDTAFGGPGFANGYPNNPGRWDIRDGTPTLSTGGNAYNLYKVGGNQVSLVGVNIDTNLANIYVNGGELGLEVNTSPTVGNPTNTITLATGTSLEFYNFAGPLNKNLIVSGGEMLDDSNRANIWFNSNAGNTNNVIIGAVTITNGLVAVGGAAAGTLSNTVSGPGGLLICGSVTLNSADTYTGNTIISNNGDLFLSGSASIANSTNINLSGTADVTGRTDTTLTLNADSSQTLSGNGTINGSLSAPAGTTVTVGTNGAVSRLTVTTNATLAGDIAMKLDAGTLTNDVLSVGGSLMLGGTLDVSVNLSGTLAAGQSFKLFNAGTYSGAFSSITPATPGANLAWDTSTLNVDGTLKVVSTIVPTPVITSISLSGTTLNISATNGSANGQYTLLESTNVALPLAQWTSVLTNNFDGSGDINLSTNVVDPSQPQTFYILQVP